MVRKGIAVVSARRLQPAAMARNSGLTVLSDARRAQIKAQALEYIVSGRTVLSTAEELGITRESLYDWRTKDRDFAKSWDDAYNAAYTRRIDHLEDIAFQRAAAGSDQLLMFLLKGGRAERYGDKRQIELNQHTSVDVRVLRSLPVNELLSRLTALRDAQRGLEIEGNVIDIDAARQTTDKTD